MTVSLRRVAANVVAIPLLLMSACQALPFQRAAKPPNIVLIISDDQRYDQMEFMPHTLHRIFDEGVAFDRAYVTTPQCCPSRSSILTGLYAHHHGVINNDLVPDATTFVEVLHENGYFTGIVGKYLNAYPDDMGDPPKPEFDSWIVFISGPRHALYYDPTINVDGEWFTFEGYQTYILRDFALSFIEEAASQDKPFLLIFAPYAPHSPAFPAPGDDELHLDVPRTKPPSFDEQDVSDKAQYIQDNPPFEQEDIDKFDLILRRQAQSLHSLDLAIVDIMDDLERRRLLDDTFIIYLSDNGHLSGEHGLHVGKVLPYEPASHVPFAVRYPRLISSPRVESLIVANIDIAPTLYDLAGIQDPPESDGRSLLPILSGDPAAADWREGVLLEAWPEHRGPNYTAMHTGRFVYIEYEADTNEFYDLQLDPYQLENQIDNPEYADQIEELSLLLRAERGQ